MEAIGVEESSDLGVVRTSSTSRVCSTITPGTQNRANVQTPQRT